MEMFSQIAHWSGKYRGCTLCVMLLLLSLSFTIPTCGALDGWILILLVEYEKIAMPYMSLPLINIELPMSLHFLAPAAGIKSHVIP